MTGSRCYGKLLVIYEETKRARSEIDNVRQLSLRQRSQFVYVMVRDKILEALYYLIVTESVIPHCVSLKVSIRSCEDE